MGLIRKPPTPRQLAANRRNAQKSTGPRTPLGKRRARMNALKHDVRARLHGRALRELGEDPQAFELLRRDLLSSFEPATRMEGLLVDDLAGLWWKKARAERAQLGVQLSELERLDFDRERRLQLATDLLGELVPLHAVAHPGAELPPQGLGC